MYLISTSIAQERFSPSITQRALVDQGIFTDVLEQKDVPMIPPLKPDRQSELKRYAVI